MSDITKALRQMRKTLVDCEAGLGFLEALALKHRIHERELTLGEAEVFRRELRTILQTLGFETTAVLIQCMILTGDPTLAHFVGVEPHQPTDEQSH